MAVQAEFAEFQRRAFAKRIDVKDAAGRVRKCSGLFAALSPDDGTTWPHVRLVTDDAPARRGTPAPG